MIASITSPTPSVPARLVHEVVAVARLAAMATLAVLAALLLAGTAPSLLGYESLVVMSGSMAPTLQVGDLAVVGAVRHDQLQAGDVISYRTAQRPDVVITHRLVATGVDEQGRPALQTKGDANDAADQVVVEPGAVLGRVAYGVPMAGYFVEFTRRPEGKLLLLACPALLLAIDAMVGARSRRAADAGITAEAIPADDLAVPIAKVAANAEAGELLSQAWIALANAGPGLARHLLDKAIAADPRCEDAWLLKATCLKDPGLSLACLEAGLVVNPKSGRLRDAVSHARTSESAR